LLVLVVVEAFGLNVHIFFYCDKWQGEEAGVEDICHLEDEMPLPKAVENPVPLKVFL